jgi:hypothetical protein
MRQSFSISIIISFRGYNEGYSLLVYPNGETYAWPVYDADDKVMLLGNLKEETIQYIWRKYPFKKNHITKYLGKSIMAVE